MKFQNFFLLLWVIFALLDPDPDSECGSGSTDLLESGYETLLLRNKSCGLISSTQDIKNMKSQVFPGIRL
jgi:hypothetical protein